jgi:trigger factor
MQVDVNTLNSYKRQLIVKIDAEELKGVETDAINKIKKNASVRGFRKGHAPAGLIKKHFAESIKVEVMESAISKFYGEALEKANINPVNQGTINNLKFDPDGSGKSGMEFEIEIEVEPEIVLKKYKGLKVERQIPVVTDKMKEEVVNNLREQYATVKELDEANEGSYITFDAQLLGEGDVPVIGRKFNDIHIKIGSGEFDLDFEKKLIGIRKGQQRIIRKTSELRSNKEKPQVESYQITTKAIQEKSLPPFDDNFVHNLQDESIKTIAELKERIDVNLKNDTGRRSHEQFVSRLIDELLKENPFDAPDSMVEHYLDHLVHDIKHQSKERKIDESAVRKNYRAHAIHNIRWHLIKKKIFEKENIKVDQKEIDELIDKMNFEEKQKKQFKQNEQFKNRIAEDLLEQKVIGLLESSAEIIEVYPVDEPGNRKADDKNK